MFNNPKSLFLFSSSSFYCTDIYFPLSLSTFISMATRASGVATSAQFTISLGYLVRKDLVLCISRFVVGISDLVCYCNICTVQTVLNASYEITLLVSYQVVPAVPSFWPLDFYLTLVGLPGFILPMPFYILHPRVILISLNLFLK